MNDWFLFWPPFSMLGGVGNEKRRDTEREEKTHTNAATLFKDTIKPR